MPAAFNSHIVLDDVVLQMMESLTITTDHFSTLPLLGWAWASIEDTFHNSWRLWAHLPLNAHTLQHIYTMHKLVWHCHRKGVPKHFTNVVYCSPPSSTINLLCTSPSSNSKWFHCACWCLVIVLLWLLLPPTIWYLWPGWVGFHCACWFVVFTPNSLRVACTLSMKLFVELMHCSLGWAVVVPIWCGDSCRFGARYLHVGSKICCIFSHRGWDLKGWRPLGEKDKWRRRWPCTRVQRLGAPWCTWLGIFIQSPCTRVQEVVGQGRACTWPG